MLRSVTLALSGLLLAASSAAADPPAPTHEADRAIRTAQLESLRLLGLLDQTRVRRDAIRAQCVDDRLAQVNSFARTLVARRRRLVVASNAQARAHERRVIRRLASQVREAAREGRACVFPPAGRASGTVVEVVVSPDVPQEDLSITPDRARR